MGLAIDLTEQIEDELAMPSISEIKRKYTWLYNETLEQALTKGTAGPFGALLLAMSTSGHVTLRLIISLTMAPVEDPAERDATFFREAVKDISRNGHKLMELLITRSPRERAGAAARVPTPTGGA